MFVSMYWWFVSHFKPTRLLTSGSSLKVGPVGGAVVTTFLYKKSYFGTKKCINCVPKTLVVYSNVVLVSFLLFRLDRHCEGFEH